MPYSHKVYATQTSINTPTTKFILAPSALSLSKVRVARFTTPPEHQRLRADESNPNARGCHFRELSQNKLQDRHIGVDLVNLACEGLLLGMQARGPAC
jgi:hypothetical protein